MSSLLQRRLARIEAALNPAPEQGFTVLIEPASEATTAEWQGHRQAISAARLRGDRVGVVMVPDNADNDRHHEAGVEYFENELHAWLAVLASRKSQAGRANRLADVLASLNGNVQGVVADPIESGETP